MIYGARTRLWAKGDQLSAGTEGAQAQWQWWLTRLEEAAERY